MRKLFIVAMIGMVSAINVFADDPPVSVPSSSPSPSIIKKEAQKADAERQKAKEEREKAEKDKGDGNSNANNNGNTTNNGGNTNDDD